MTADSAQDRLAAIEKRAFDGEEVDPSELATARGRRARESRITRPSGPRGGRQGGRRT